MKKLLLLLVLLTGKNSFAQISGHILSTIGEPIAFASVAVLSATDSSLIKGSLTDEQGFFLIETGKAGRYFVKTTAVGFQSWSSSFFSTSSPSTIIDLGKMVLQNDTLLLDEVTIRQQKPVFQQTMEGIIVNVGESSLSKGASVLDILERSPGIVVDQLNNGISLNGKADVIVVLDGKRLRLNMEQVFALLRGMNSNNIARIELLSSPGARYDADGNGGVLHIITMDPAQNEKKQATAGSFTLTGGHGRNEKTNGSLTLSHTGRKISTYGTYAFLWDHTYSKMHFDSWQTMPALGGDLYVNGLNTTQAKLLSNNITVGADFQLSKKTTLGINVVGNRSNRKTTDRSRASYTILPDSISKFNGTIDGSRKLRNWINSIYFESKRSDKESYVAAIDYIYFESRTPSEVLNTFLTESGEQAGNNDTLFAPRQRGFASTFIHVGEGKLDYTKQLSPNLKFEAGLKVTYTRNKSKAGIESRIDNEWVSRNETADEIVMSESIKAGYLSLNAQLNPKLSLIAGTRYEFSQTTMTNTQTGQVVVNRKLGMLFPSISLAKKISDASTLQLSYTKRIGRPSFSDLASFLQYSDPSAVYTGNPFLKPTVTSNLKVQYSYNNYDFSLITSRDTHPIARYQITEGPERNLLYIGPQNLRWQKSATFQASSTQRINSWWDLTAVLSGGIRSFRAEHTLVPVTKTYMAYSANISQTFKLYSNITAELSGWYNSFSFNGTTRVAGLGTLNFGLKKNFQKNPGSLSLMITDLLQTVRYQSRYGTITQEAFSIRNLVQINPETQFFPIARITYSKSFGKTVTRKPSKTKSTELENRFN